MLNPASIALVGASARPGALGRSVHDLLRHGGFPGVLYPVNHKYPQIHGAPCYPDLRSLPEAPDLVVMVVGSRSVESVVRDAMDVGAGGIVIFASNYLEDDTEPALLCRLKDLSAAAGIPVCGGNGMGFYNYAARALVSFDTPPERPGGNIALIAHSGSVMTYLANTDPRMMFNLVVSPGQEINGTAADYMHYALAMPDTRVIALFLETVRDPEGFCAALYEARQRRIPVVIVKVGATEQSARLAASHSGAVAGRDSAFQAICDRYGAIRVRDIDELSATALLLSHVGVPGPGDLSGILDSGGLREQMIDLAPAAGVRFARLTETSRAGLAEVLEHGLVAENPVDAMGAINVDVGSLFSRCLGILGDDPGTAMVSLEFEFRDGFSQYPQLLEVARDCANRLPRPLVVINSTASVGNSREAAALGRHGIPVINGISNALAAIGNAFRYRDNRLFPCPERPAGSPDLSRWRALVRGRTSLEEADALELVRDHGLPVAPFAVADSLEAACSAAFDLGYPVVLKSARPGLKHKSDQGGVRTDLRDRENLVQAYAEMAASLGPRMLIASMAGPGVELGFGMINDGQFGPVLMLGAGGIHVELFSERQYVPAPCSGQEALHALRKLNVSKLLEGGRGRAPCRIDLVAETASRFSWLAHDLRGCWSEMDLNPVIVTPDACTIVDALIIT